MIIKITTIKIVRKDGVGGEEINSPSCLLLQNHYYIYSRIFYGKSGAGAEETDGKGRTQHQLGKYPLREKYFTIDKYYNEMF